MRIGMKTAAAMALAAFVVAALPAVAAAQPSSDTTEKHFTVTTKAGEVIELRTPGATVACTQATGTGELTGTSPYTTGTLELSFHGCKSSGFNCTTSGQPAGTITSEPLTFHLVTATKGGVAKNAVLITSPASEIFATFNCTFLVHVQLDGKGIVGEIETATNTESNTLNVVFKADAGNPATQDLEVVCGLGTFDITATVNGNPETAALIGTGQAHLTNGAIAKLT